MTKRPVEMPRGRRQCFTVGRIISPFGKPARQIGGIGRGEFFIEMPAKRSVRVLYVQQPACRAIGGNAHVVVVGFAVPCSQPMQYLSGVERRRGGAVIGDLEPRKRAVRQLYGQQESYRPLGALVEPGTRQGAAQGEKGRYDIPGSFRVGRRPPAIEPVAAGNTAVRLTILRRGQPLRCRTQMIVVGKAAKVALAIERLMQQKGRMPAGPGTVARQTFQLRKHAGSRLHERRSRYRNRSAGQVSRMAYHCRVNGGLST